MHVLLLCPLGAVVLRFFKGDTLPFPVELPHHRYWSTQQGTVHIHLCVPWKRGEPLTKFLPCNSSVASLEQGCKTNL